MHTGTHCCHLIQASPHSGTHCCRLMQASPHSGRYLPLVIILGHPNCQYIWYKPGALQLGALQLYKTPATVHIQLRGNESQ